MNDAPLDDRTRAILDDRARTLSRELVPEQKRDHAELLTFSRRGTSYAVGAGLVREVAKLDELTAIPGVPAPFLGIVTIRGRIVPVADLALLLGSTEADGAASYVLVLDAAGPELGLVADTVDDVGGTDEGAIHDAPAALAATGFVEGVTGGGTIVLAGKSLLADRRLFVDRVGHEATQEGNRTGS